MRTMVSSVSKGLDAAPLKIDGKFVFSLYYASLFPFNSPLTGTHIIQMIFTGSILEGGGQILRNAASLASITGTAIHINNIRAKRPKPGLRPQHLTGLELVASLSEGTLDGGAVGSTQITLHPGTPRCLTTTVDTRTAGSCMLLAQIALPCLLFALPGESPDSPLTQSILELKGGTDAAMAPQVDYMVHVLLPILRQKLHIAADIDLIRRGFYPRGQGLVKLSIAPLPPNTPLPAFKLISRGTLLEISIFSFTAGKVKPLIGERMATTAEQVIKRRLKTIAPAAADTPEKDLSNASETPVLVNVTHEPPERAFGEGCGIVIIAKTASGCLLGGSALGERGVSAETVGQRAADELMDFVESGACVDDWLMDQLIIFMALAEGDSEIVGREPSLHTRTAVAVAEALTQARFTVAQRGHGLWSIKCQGAGIQVVNK